MNREFKELGKKFQKMLNASADMGSLEENKEKFSTILVEFNS